MRYSCYSVTVNFMIINSQKVTYYIYIYIYNI